MGRTISLGYEPRPWQRKVHVGMMKHRYNVMVVHRRGGKTLMCVVTAVDAAMRTLRRDARYGYVAPFLKQAKQISWDYFKKYAALIPGTVIKESELLIKFPNGALIQLFGADNAEAMRGLYFDGIVLDEVAQFKPSIYGEIIHPTLTDRKGWATFIGTPKGANLFHDLYEKALTDKKWGAWMFDVTDTHVLDQEELDDAREIMTAAQYRQEFLCDFGASSDNVLITIDLVTDAMRRKAVTGTKLKGLPKILGVDVARFGDDSSVIQFRWGHLVYDPVKLKDRDNMEVAARVASMSRELSPDVIFIDGGRGEGVIDRCRQLGVQNVVEVQAQHRARNQTHYKDRRAEMWDGVRKALEDGLILPEHSELKRDLCTPTYDFTVGSGLFELESSKKIKKERGRSLDFGSALALTYADPVVHREVDPIARYDRSRLKRGQLKADYDPIEEFQEAG